MKKIYQNPAIKFVDMEAMSLLADTKVPTGNPYNPGDPVLSRHKSIWDDDEDTEEDY